MISFIIKFIILYLILGLLVLLICYNTLLELYIKRKKHIKYENMHTIINPTVKFYKLGQHLTEKDRNKFTVLNQCEPDIYNYIDLLPNFYKTKDNSSITGTIIDRNVLNDMIDKEKDKYLYKDYFDYYD